MATKRHVLALLATLSFALIVTLAACGDDDVPASGEAPDAAVEAADGNADPCDEFKGSGKPCSLGPGRICFAQCATGGCFCQNGIWACRTDTSCVPEGGPLADVITPVEDTGPVDATTDTEPGDAGDAADDVMDASNDAPDAG